MDMTPVIAKIQKLFALANQSKNNSEAEATSAMAKAQELLAKYNLDMQTVQDTATGPSGSAASSGPREKTTISRSAMYRWQQEFWRELCQLNYCFHWVVEKWEAHPKRPGVNRRVKRHVILGSQANVAVVQMMGEYLTEVMERELPYPNNERLSQSAISWREGMAARLIERITRKMESMKREGFVGPEGVRVTALAVQDLHEKEYAANYDSEYGAGAYAKMKARHANWDKEAAERQAKRAEERARLLGSETAEQRAAREKAEAKAAAKQQAADARYWEREFRKQQRRDAKRDMVAYARGAKKADSVNLDQQVKGGN